MSSAQDPTAHVLQQQLSDIQAASTVLPGPTQHINCTAWHHTAHQLYCLAPHSTSTVLPGPTQHINCTAWPHTAQRAAVVEDIDM
jgi:hypothetical protein